MAGRHRVQMRSVHFLHDDLLFARHCNDFAGRTDELSLCNQQLLHIAPALSASRMGLRPTSRLLFLPPAVRAAVIRRSPYGPLPLCSDESRRDGALHCSGDLHTDGALHCSGARHTGGALRCSGARHTAALPLFGRSPYGRRSRYSGAHHTRGALRYSGASPRTDGAPRYSGARHTDGALPLFRRSPYGRRSVIRALAIRGGALRCSGGCHTDGGFCSPSRSGRRVSRRRASRRAGCGAFFRKLIVVCHNGFLSHSSGWSVSVKLL